MPKIAISYRRADSAPIADRIRERLVACYGQDEIFLDIHNVPLGCDFPAHVQNVWSDAQVLLVLIGRNWRRDTEPISLRLALQYLGFATFVLLVAHYLIVNVYDLDIVYLRIAAFVVHFPFGAAFFWQTRTKPASAFVVGAALGVIAAAAMTISASLRYHQPIMPIDVFEWLESAEYGVIIAAGFMAGNLLARLPRVSSWFDHRNDWVRVEVETAIGRSIPIIPILLDGATIPSPGQLPKTMRKLGYYAATEVRSGIDFDAHMTRLVGGIDAILSGSTRSSPRLSR